MSRRHPKARRATRSVSGGGLAFLLLVAALGCAEPGLEPVGHSHDEATVDESAFHMEPAQVRAGDRIAARFAAGVERGPAFSLERQVDGGWLWEWAVSNEAARPEVQIWTAQRFTENHVDWPAGPVIETAEPHLLPIPRQAVPGTYRACTTGADVTPRCAEFEVIAPG